MSCSAAATGVVQRVRLEPTDSPSCAPSGGRGMVGINTGGGRVTATARGVEPPSPPLTEEGSAPSAPRGGTRRSKQKVDQKSGAIGLDSASLNAIKSTQASSDRTEDARLAQASGWTRSRARKARSSGHRLAISNVGRSGEHEGGATSIMWTFGQLAEMAAVLEKARVKVIAESRTTTTKGTGEVSTD